MASSTAFFSFRRFFSTPLKGSTLKKCHGIFTLKNAITLPICFTPPNGQFDNVEGFLKANDCEQGNIKMITQVKD
ncbi:MAG: hypothetical protein IPK25_09495 [Saprospiraceae bacterium]|nr:hypothetical protein [Saprospiraceae bacterium]